MWITRVSIKNPVFATMVMVALCVLGLFAWPSSASSRCPTSPLPGAWIEVRYPGASPEAVEREIAKPLEEVINTIAGVKRIQSRSFEGPGADERRVRPRRRHGPRDAGAARPRVAGGAGRLPEGRQGADSSTASRNDNQPVVVGAVDQRHAQRRASSA
jgi:multidrug efflux pump subunit AcrB